MAMRTRRLAAERATEPRAVRDDEVRRHARTHAGDANVSPRQGQTLQSDREAVRANAL